MAHPNAIKDKELNTAKRMAKRKSGVTRAQLAEKLNITVARSTQILKRVGAKGAVPAKPVKGANRTKVFNLAA